MKVVSFAAKIGVILAAAALALIPLPAGWVESAYSARIYPVLQSRLTSLSNHVPFAVCDVLAILTVLALVLVWALRLRSSAGQPIRTLARALLDTAALAALVYLVFLGAWGLNYRRVPLARKLDYDEARGGREAMDALVRRTVESLNADVGPAHRSSWPQDEEMRRRLRLSFEAAAKDLGVLRSPLLAVPKISLADPYLGAAGISGFTNPFGLEVIFNTALLPIEKPFTLAHEWAHLAGFADESEANFIALLACARSADPAIRYSGWLALYRYLPAPPRSHQVSSERPQEPPKALRVSASIAAMRGRQSRDRGPGHDGSERVLDRRLDPLPALDPQVSSDLRAIDARIQRRLRPALGRAQSGIYDRFLKANSVKSGIASYGLFVRLLIGTRFESAWVPVRRAGS